MALRFSNNNAKTQEATASCIADGVIHFHHFACHHFFHFAGKVKKSDEQSEQVKLSENGFSLCTNLKVVTRKYHPDLKVFLCLLLPHFGHILRTIFALRQLMAFSQ